jgi:DNA polymerase delta subunit 2
MAGDGATRASATRAIDDARFSLANKMHGQYFQLYFNRLQALKPRAREAARARWPTMPTRAVLELCEDEACVIVGTIYKDMKDKPIILDEYVKGYGEEAEGAAATTREERATYTREDDGLEFEDEGARVKLLGVDAGKFVTGVVCAVKGKAVKGDFLVDDVVAYAPPTTGEAKKSKSEASTATKYVCLVSGFEIGGNDAAASARNQMFVDYVTGASIAYGDESPSDSDAAKICRIMLAELASAVPVDVMSGKTDPTNKAMPQQPLHPVYFPEASKYEKTMCLVTNPHDLTVDQTSFLGTSGQNVEDVMKFSTIDADDVSSAFVGAAAAKRPVAALTQTLRWQHIAPGAPDTLACYPFKDRDPFVIERTPRVYFAGCQDAFGYERVSHDPAAGVADTLVVAVPKFSSTGIAVLVDIDTLSCRSIQFL